MKTDLLNFTLSELGEFLISLGEKGYRAKQLFKWIYQQMASSFQEMTDLPIPFRERLNKCASILNMKIKDKKVSTQSGAIKYLHQLWDNELIETVLIVEKRLYYQNS